MGVKDIPPSHCPKVSGSKEAGSRCFAHFAGAELIARRSMNSVAPLILFPDCPQKRTDYDEADVKD